MKISAAVAIFILLIPLFAFNIAAGPHHDAEVMMVINYLSIQVKSLLYVIIVLGIVVFIVLLISVLIVVQELANY